MNDQALHHLAQDPIMAQLISQYQLTQLQPMAAEAIFGRLCESIISQQLSVRVADVITERIYKLLPKGTLQPEAILALDQEALRRCGVSYAKIRYLRSAADAAVSGLVAFELLPSRADDEVIAELTQIVGVGRWTAEMQLIFCLGRPDIFSIGDLGLRTAVSRLYGLDRQDLAAILARSEQWSPYRSLASRYLWASLDNEP